MCPAIREVSSNTTTRICSDTYMYIRPYFEYDACIYQHEYTQIIYLTTKIFWVDINWVTFVLKQLIDKIRYIWRSVLVPILTK